MAAISRFLRSSEGGGLMYWCQGCESIHGIQVGEGPGPRWGYNGNPDKPTFTPSVLVTGRDFTAKGKADYEAWAATGRPFSEAPQFDVADTRCHTFITDGMVQFLGDCSHALAGQTLPLPELPERLRDGAPPQP